jgi:putative ABC transport system permease protein
VLALVALFVGAFLVYSVVALSVAQRTPSFALLGVLGLTARERRTLVLAECALLGLVGSMAGLVLGAGMALGALRWLAGDLGGGYFPGIAPALQWDGLGVAAFGALGLASALVGGWVPARRAEALQPAQALKGLGGDAAAAPAPTRAALALLALGVALAMAPPVGGLPLAAYASVAALLVGGVALVPAAVNALLALPGGRGSALTLLAWQRARHQRHTATAAVAGVVASLALSVALTVMVTSFRQGVADWLDRVLPADLYARTASSSGASDQAWLPADFVARVAALPGVRRVEASRVRTVNLAAGRPPVVLVARELANPAASLPLVEAPAASAQVSPPARRLAPPEASSLPEAWVSEAMVTLYGAVPGSVLRLPIDGLAVDFLVRGVWRDYARQFGTVAIDRVAYQRLTGDNRVNDLALWLAPGAAMADVKAALRAAAPDAGMLEFAATDELRRLSLAIFDRSFAVTYYLQAVAIGIGLVGVAASLSAQVLARRKEFGLLSHLGLTRTQVVGVVAGETLAWLAAGALVGLALGLAISVVLVHVVNPQSFHWTMELVLPWARLAALAAAVLVAGTATAAFSARRAASRAAVLSVKEDW